MDTKDYKYVTLPMQPICGQGEGTVRFVPNRIVEALLQCASEGKKLDLNDIACMDFSVEERQQFAQLIGYSLSGYGSLSYVTDESYDTAHHMFYDGVDEKDAKIQALTSMIQDIREPLAKAAESAFRVNAEDLLDNEEF